MLNSDGDILGDVNGGVPRIPASNQKLISTAFALDRLGPDFRLKTRLIQRPDGSLELNGEGDPDLESPACSVLRWQLCVRADPWVDLHRRQVDGP